jgi:hypothetical protein
VTSRPLLATLAWLLVCVLPLSLLGLAVGRRRPRVPLRSVNTMLGLGAALGVSSLLIERAVLRLTIGLDAGLGAGPIPLLVAVGFVGPLEEGLKVAAVWPSFKARVLRGPLEGVTGAIAASAGFAGVEAGWALASGNVGLGSLDLISLALITTMQALLAASWGYVIGHSYRRSGPRQGFFGTWAGAAVAHGVLEHLLSLRTTGGLLASLPLVVAMAVLALMARGELRAGAVFRHRRTERRARSLLEIREALARRERPLGVGRIAGGALMNQGVLFVMLALSVVIANRAGVDFSQVDDAEAPAVVPLFFLVGGAVVAFPLAAFLMARGSDHPTLIEPALSAALAIVVLMVVLGLAAPVALAVALAFTPIALVLALAGAWVGVGR